MDFHDPDTLMAAIDRIMNDYDRYSQASLRFFNETDNTDTLKALLEDAFSQTKAEKK